MSHINISRLIVLAVAAAVGTFATAFSVYIGAHPINTDATAGALLSSINAASVDAVQKALGAAAMAIVGGLTRLDQGTPANGLRPADAPIAEQPVVALEVGSELEKRLAAAIADAIGAQKPQ